MAANVAQKINISSIPIHLNRRSLVKSRSPALMALIEMNIAVTAMSGGALLSDDDIENAPETYHTGRNLKWYI